MNRRNYLIWKHELPFATGATGTYELNLHDSAIILSVAEQDGKLVLWEMHFDNELEMTTRNFCVAFTGRPFALDVPLLLPRCIGTVTGKYGLVYHVLEL